MDAESGVALGGMFKALKESGFDIEGVLSSIGTKIKDIVATKSG